jgi:hypothetical protein
MVNVEDPNPNRGKQIRSYLLPRGQFGFFFRRLLNVPIYYDEHIIGFFVQCNAPTRRNYLSGFPGVYILVNNHPPASFGGKNKESRREKSEKFKRKREERGMKKRKWEVKG